ncbi:hypothetical protein BCR33DRAFT_767233 [Rhizoclosmatium globosum]|uniref:Uncharacterized protein n=1 Tax=Rhizoclosmatium globosum TaxID=329046 RepID=A0A1Y2C473_9FUNG|nr:hypothetical protein BCR33DRAFT_767233 [Rhizoclosmatium globosum]|eukprot:ORY41832.1 hypothetical protein BCR33DRAFT_767233 [Rhizoclosmatium globosum]
MIVVSRWFEVTSTSLDMIFGVTTIWAIVYPHIDRKKQIRNMQFALVGILLTPTFTLLDSFIQNTYWAMIGVGYFEKRGIQNFFLVSFVGALEDSLATNANTDSSYRNQFELWKCESFDDYVRVNQLLVKFGN